MNRFDLTALLNHDAQLGLVKMLEAHREITNSQAFFPFVFGDTSTDILS